MKLKKIKCPNCKKSFEWEVPELDDVSYVSGVKGSKAYLVRCNNCEAKLSITY